MKLFIIYILFAYIAAAVQGLFFNGIKPDIVLVLVCYYSVISRGKYHIAYGASTGLLLDTVNGVILGPHILSKAIIAYISGRVKENLFQWNIVISTSMILISSIIDIFIVDACLQTFSKVSLVHRTWSVSMIGTVYTVMASMLLYLLFNRKKGRGLV